MFDENEVEKDIHKLKLHETTTINLGKAIMADVTRVDGGWIYQYVRNSVKYNPVFVPYLG